MSNIKPSRLLLVSNAVLRNITIALAEYPLNYVKHWLSIDSVSFAGSYLSTCNLKIPLNGIPTNISKTGNACIISNDVLPKCQLW